MADITPELIKKVIQDDNYLATTMREVFKERSDDQKTVKFGEVANYFNSVCDESGYTAPSSDEIQILRSENTKAQDDQINFETFCAESKLYFKYLAKQC
jgi:hypothetical protein